MSLLDAEGAISEQFERCLKHIFAKYCTPAVLTVTNGELLEPPPNAFLSAKGLDDWARDTNGAPFPQETKDELVEFLDVNDNGDLTLKGFIQIYQLQSENDEEETWKDLAKHGFDQHLNLTVTTQK